MTRWLDNIPLARALASRATATRAGLAAAGWHAVASVVTGCSPPAIIAVPPAGDDGWGASTTTAAPDRPAAPGRPPTIEPDLRKPWARNAELRTWPTIGTRHTSDHLGGGYQRSIRRNELAAGYEGPGGPPIMPPGAIIAQLHYAPGNDDVVTVFVMEKRSPGHAPAVGDWEYLVLDEQWRVEAQGGLRVCADCHRAGIRDWLFGLPRPATADLPGD